jgi:hypothetical protein
VYVWVCVHSLSYACVNEKQVLVCARVLKHICLCEYVSVYTCTCANAHLVTCMYVYVYFFTNVCACGFFVCA